MMPHPRRAVALMAMLGAAACTPKPETPDLSLGDRVCAGQPALSAATPVPLGERDGATVELTRASPCVALKAPDAKVTYAAFRLPDGLVPYSVTISSVVKGGVLVPARAWVLDDHGAVTRTLSADMFEAFWNGLRTGLRRQPGEQYIVVLADPTRLGTTATLRLSRARENAVQVAAAAPVFIPVIPYSPSPVPIGPVTYGLNGTVNVSATLLQVVR